VIAEALGGRVVRAPAPVHGQASSILHEQCGLFAGLPSPLTVGRYHSLVVEPDSLPSQLRVTARTRGMVRDQVLMALEHKELPVYGVQFHPESILTEHGYELLANFLRLAGMEPVVDPRRLARSERLNSATPDPPLPNRPITF
jgi:anthranilate synthase/aminodeoxychorismate synthase-like glutamine amidotransferase